MRPLLALFVAAPLAGVACQMPAYSPSPSYASNGPSTTGAAAPSSGSGGSSTGSPVSNARAATATPAAPIPTSVEVHSDCSKTVPVFYGEKPGFSSGTKSSVSSNSTSSQSRNPDGTLTMWIIDDHENGITSVQITPSTRRVEIDSSCKSLRTQ